MSGTYAFLIIGGGPAGLAAARAYRQRESDGRVAIVTDEHLIPYNRPPLTKELLRGESTIAELPIEPEAWFEGNRVELIGGRAVALDTAAHTVTLSGGRRLDYDVCLLATGAEPQRPDIPGADHPRVAVMRSLDDLRRLEARLGEGLGEGTIAVVGSGFIACEIASSLRARGHGVQLVSSETLPNAARLGEPAAEAIAGWLADDGVRLSMGNAVASITHRDGHATVNAGAEAITADLVVLGTGVAPRGELALAAGLAMDAGAVCVDASMRTSVDGVLGAGDLVLAENRTAGRALRVEHWGDALGQGEVAGQVAAGSAAAWDAVPGFWSTIGGRTLKYLAWGDGFDELAFTPHPDGGFSVRYGAGGRLVGLLAHQADEAYAAAEDLIARGAPWTR